MQRLGVVEIASPWLRITCLPCTLMLSIVKLSNSVVAVAPNSNNLFVYTVFILPERILPSRPTQPVPKSIITFLGNKLGAFVRVTVTLGQAFNLAEIGRAHV